MSKYSLTSGPEVIVVFHGEYKRTLTHTLKFSTESTNVLLPTPLLLRIWVRVRKFGEENNREMEDLEKRAIEDLPVVSSVGFHAGDKTHKAVVYANLR